MCRKDTAQNSVRGVSKGDTELLRGGLLKRYPEPHGQVTAYNRSPVH